MSTAVNDYQTKRRAELLQEIKTLREQIGAAEAKLAAWRSQHCVCVNGQVMLKAPKMDGLAALEAEEKSLISARNALLGKWHTTLSEHAAFQAAVGTAK